MAGKEKGYARTWGGRQIRDKNIYVCQQSNKNIVKNEGGIAGKAWAGPRGASAAAVVEISVASRACLRAVASNAPRQTTDKCA